MNELLLTIKNELYARKTCKKSRAGMDPDLPVSGAASFENQKSNQTKLSKLSCVFCKENHFSDKCPKVTDIANTFEIQDVVFCVSDQEINFRML